MDAVGAIYAAVYISEGLSSDGMHGAEVLGALVFGRSHRCLATAKLTPSPVKR